MTIQDFVGRKVVYDLNSGSIYAEHPNKERQILADVRGWGAILNGHKREDGGFDHNKARDFQDELGEWMAQAINNQLTNSSTNEVQD